MPRPIWNDLRNCAGVQIHGGTPAQFSVLSGEILLLDRFPIGRFELGVRIEHIGVLDVFGARPDIEELRDFEPQGEHYAESGSIPTPFGEAMPGFGDQPAFPDAGDGLRRSVVGEDLYLLLASRCLDGQHGAEAHLIGGRPDEVEGSRWICLENILGRLDAFLAIPVGRKRGDDFDSGVRVNHRMESTEARRGEETAGNTFDDGPSGLDLGLLGRTQPEIEILPEIEIKVIGGLYAHFATGAQNARTSEVVQHGIGRDHACHGIVKTDIGGHLDAFDRFKKVDHDNRDFGGIGLLENRLYHFHLDGRDRDDVHLALDEILNDGDLIGESGM